MKIEIDFEGLVKEFKNKEPEIREELDRVGGRLYTEKVLSNAAPMIETLLRMVSSLPSRGNKIQFYDTESDAAKAAKNWDIPKNTGDPHLIEMWKVEYDVDADGNGKIIVINDKLVGGKTGDYFLFNLLWNGTDPYIVGASMSDKKKRTVTKGKMWKSGMNKGNRRPDKVSYALSEQERFKKKYGKAAYKIWEDKIKDQLVHQGRILGHRNYHISAVEQHHRMLKGGKRKEPEAVDRERLARINQVNELAGTKTRFGGKYGEASASGKTTQTITQQYGTYGGSGFKSLIYAQGLIKEFAPPRMRFYCRFGDRFVYNQIYRKGIEGKVVEDFHDYVATCVWRGLMMAAGPEINKGFDAYELEREMYYS